MKLQESQVLLAKQLINYANLPTTKKAYLDADDEIRFRTLRPGCPLTERKLTDEMSDLIRSLIRHMNVPFETKKRLRFGLDSFKPAQLKSILQNILSK